MRSCATIFPGYLCPVCQGIPWHLACLVGYEYVFGRYGSHKAVGRSYVRLLGSTVYRFLERQHTPHSTQMAYISTKHACKHACMVPFPSSRGVSVLWFLSEGFTRIFIHSYTSTSVRVAERGSLISKHLQCTSPAVHLQTAVLIVLLIIHTEVVTIPVQQ